MREKPILFNTEMVHALLDGRKTVTRRIIKNKDIINAWDCEMDGTPIAYIDQETGDSHSPTMPCPYQPGDILYVRETWQYAYDLDGNEQPIEGTGRYLYAADGPEPPGIWVNSDGSYRDSMPWRPSIHMPREAARIFLRVTNVRVERLRDIGDCTKEGIPRGKHETAHMNDYDERCDFKALWDSTIKPADRALYGWEANPWVWVIEFERISRKEALSDV